MRPRPFVAGFAAALALLALPGPLEERRTRGSHLVLPRTRHAGLPPALRESGRLAARTPDHVRLQVLSAAHANARRSDCRAEYV